MATKKLDLNDSSLPDTGDLNSYVVLPYVPSNQADGVSRNALVNFVVRKVSNLRTYPAARLWAVGQVSNPSQNWSGLCQKFSRSVINAGAWGTSALNAWNAIPAAHKFSGVPRGGALAYFGNSQPGHVVFVDPANPAYCFSSDILRAGKIDRVPLKLITAKWGLRYLGWIDWTPSGAINLVPVPVVIPASSNPVSLSKVQPVLTNGSVVAVQSSLKTEGLYTFQINGKFDANTQIAYSKWQKKMGYTGADANGVPGIKSLTDLGIKYKFKVVA